jgi:hypothetical protein
MGAAAMIAGHPDRVTVTLLRAPAPLQNESGVFEAQDATPSSISVVLHPLDGERLEQVPEADRVESMIELYATEALYVTRGSRSADRVVYESETYRVVHVDPQRAGGVWLAYASLEEPEAE